MYEVSRWGFRALLLAALLLTSLTMNSTQASEGPPQQVIIKWREAPSAAEQKARTASSLREAGARHGAKLEFLRIMGTGASIYKIDPALPERELAALIKTLSSDSHVEYAEADSIMRTMPRN
jgi:hypothetical protein